MVYEARGDLMLDEITDARDVRRQREAARILHCEFGEQI